MAQIETFKNFGESTLAADYVAASGTLEVVDDTKFPDSVIFHLALDNPEKTIFAVDSSASNPYEGTGVENDANAPAGTVVKLVLTSQSMDQIKKDQVTMAGFFTNGQGGTYPPKEGLLHLFTDSPHIGRNKSTQTDVDLWYTGAVPAKKAGNVLSSALNAGTSSYNTTGQGAAPRLRSAVEATSEGIHGRYDSVPTSAFTRTLGLIPDAVYSDALMPYEGPLRAGIFAMESGTGKIITLGCKFDVASGVYLTEIIYWDDVTTVNTIALLKSRRHYLDSPLWYRIQRAGSNLIYSATTNKYLLDQSLGDIVVLNEALTTFFTTEPNRCGAFIYNGSTDEEFSAKFVSWEPVG